MRARSSCPRRVGALIVVAVVSGITSATVVATRSPTASVTTAARCDATAAVAAWPLERRVSQLLIVGVEPYDAASIVSQFPVGGIFLRTPTDGGLVTDGGAHFVALEPVPPFVAIDEEGGRVQRIPNLVGDIPSARAMAATLTPHQVRRLALERGRAMRSYGITMDFAPDVDVSNQAENDVIGDRSFSNHPDVVARYATAFAAGLRQAGVIPVYKHFPGHGHAVGDSHTGASVTPPLAALRKSDLLPYETLLDRDAVVMVGHLDVPGLTTADEPASINAATITGLLRRTLKFRGLVITDDLEDMGAISLSHGLGDASIRALQAGATMVLSKTDGETAAVVAAISDAVRAGTLDESVVNADVRQVLARKGFDPCAA